MRKLLEALGAEPGMGGVWGAVEFLAGIGLILLAIVRHG